MKIKTSELTEAALDLVVAKCAGLLDQWGVCAPAGFRPSTDWAQGGPIIERELDMLVKQDSGQWLVSVSNPKVAWYLGPTPLIAAMRCYVASKLGEEVEVPEELV